MAETEKDEIVYRMVMGQFIFAKELAKALNGGEENEELETFILKEMTKELQHLLDIKKD